MMLQNAYAQVKTSEAARADCSPVAHPNSYISCNMLLTMNLEIHASWRKPENQGFYLQSQGKY